MKVLVTGCSGQVGVELMRQGKGSHEMIGMTRTELDITDVARVKAIIVSEKPDIIVNAAAYTAVDKAEVESNLCFAVNCDGPKYLAQASQLADIPLIHISTDYVFDGSKSGAYVETDSVSPVGVYGRSKAEGEEQVRHSCEKHIILRTSWVFSSHGNNFVQNMLRLGAEREELGVVSDQHGCPTSAVDIAAVILQLCERHAQQWGTYHFCQPEPTTWHGFAKAIFAEAARQGLLLKIKNVAAIGTDDYPTAAKRPANSVLECSKLKAVFAVVIRPWKESLAEVVKELSCV